MEVGMEPSMPTYSGGLGVLAGDSLRAAADAGVPMVGVTLLHRKGYFRQSLDDRGNQSETPVLWSPETLLEPLTPRAAITLEGRRIFLRAWRYWVRGCSGHALPVYFLDTALDQNTPWDRTLTDFLYGGDQHYRLCQEAVLGLGGLAMLRALGHEEVQSFHLNEGHSALLTLGLIAEKKPENGALERVRDDIRRRCVFTTHTPVPAGQDQFPTDLVRHVLGEDLVSIIARTSCCLNGTLNMTYLGLFFAHYVNGVAMKHGEISRGMFPNYPINSITNGVHAVTWTAEPFQKLYDAHIHGWRQDNLYLRYAVSMPLGEIQRAHDEAKHALLAEVERRNGVKLDPAMLTLGFARRA